VNPADQPILFLVVTSNLLSLSQLDDYAENALAQRISMVKGVAQVSVFGSQKYAVRIRLDPRALSSRGIAIGAVSDAVQAANVNLPTGVLYGPLKSATVQARGQLQNAAEFGNLIVSYKGGSPVRLRDVAEVTDDVQNNKVASWFKGRRNITLAVQRQPGVNTVEVASAVQKLVDRLRAQLPQSVEVNTLYVMKSQKRIPYRKVGHLLRFDFEEIVEWTKPKQN